MQNDFEQQVEAGGKGSEMLLQNSRKRRTACVCMAAILAAVLAFLVFSCGRAWQKAEHPDEVAIERWVKETQEEGYIHKRVYPEGFFQLARVFTWVDDMLDSWQMGWNDWVVQPNAQGHRKYAEGDDEVLEGGEALLFRMRAWNVWLGTWSTIFVFFTVLLISNSVTAALLGALLLAYNPLVVEHLHYGETEGAMLFSMTLALWLSTLAIKKRSVWWCRAAALSMGFAAACKFSLAVMVPLAVVLGVVVGRLQGRRWRWLWAEGAGCLGLAGFGFVLGTPMVWMAPESFVYLLKRTAGRTYGEVNPILARMKGVPFAYVWLQARSLLNSMRHVPLLFWCGVLPALACWCRRGLRNYLYGVPLFGMVYVIAVVCAFPWFRDQELIPVVCCATVVIAVALAWATEAICTGRWGWKVAGAIGWALALAALCAVGLAGIRMSSNFSVRDVREGASRWYRTCGPLERKVTVESYTSIVGELYRQFPRYADDVIALKKIEGVAANVWRDRNISYVVRSDCTPGRGIMNPRTGKLFPQYQKNREEGLAQMKRIGRWYVEGDCRPMFAQVGSDLLCVMPEESAKADVDFFADAPIFVHWRKYGTHWHRARDGGDAFGPLDGVRVTGRRTTVYLSATAAEGKWYAVVANLSEEGAAEIRWDRGFEPRRKDVEARSAELFEAESEKLHEVFSTTPSVRVRMKGDDQRTMCLAFFTTDRAFAEDLLGRFGGREARAGATAAELKVASDLLGTGDGEGSGVALRGYPIERLDDFSRIRLGRLSLWHLIDEAEEEGKLKVELPVVLWRGRSELEFHLDDAWEWRARGEDMLSEFSVDNGKLLGVTAVEEDGGLMVRFALEGDGSAGPLRVCILEGERQHPFLIDDVCLRWHPADSVRWAALSGKDGEP